MKDEERRQNILKEIFEERSRQIKKWTGVFNDLLYSPFDWHEMISDYNGWARRMWSMRSYDKARKRLIQVAALAVAAVEALDVKHATGENTDDS